MDSKIGKLYPSTKFMAALLLIVVSIFMPGYYMQYLVFPVIIIISFLAKTGRQFLGAFFKSVFFIILFIFIIQVFIITNKDQLPIWAFLHFSRTGLMNSLALTSKIIAIGSVIMWFFQVTKVKDIIFTLEKSGMPKKISFLISSTIQLIPQMTNLSRTIADAQKSRGIETQGSLIVRMKAFIPMFGPLVLSSIQQTEERVLALESRAFSSRVKKTSIYILEKKAIDYGLEVLCVVCLTGFIVWRII